MKAKIHPSNLAKFHSKIKALNKRIDTINTKSDVQLPSIILSNEIEIPPELDLFGKIIKHAYISIDVDGFDTEIKFNGWSFIGVIDHMEAGNILRAAPKKEIPSTYSTSSGNCDHCKTKRSRKTTAIIFNESTGEFKQCGLSCVSFYTLSKSAEYYIDLYQSLMDCILGFGEGKSDYRQSLLEILINTAFCADRFGIVTKSGEKLVPTVQRVALSLVNRFESPAHKTAFIDTFGSFPIAIGDRHLKVANEALAWIQSNESTNQFLSNLKTVSKLTLIDQKHFSLACWIVLSYLIEVEKQKKLKADFATRENVFIGSIGEKIEVVAECVKSFVLFESQYGTTFMNIFRTSEGNTISWRTTKQFNKGTLYKISSKVSAHTEYKGTNQTEIKRAKISELERKSA